MIRLIPYELGKIWRKRSFQVLTALLLFLNLFLIWYLNIPAENAPPLSAYQTVCSDIAGMSEAEKLTFITERKEQTDGISIINDVMNLQPSDDKKWGLLVEQMQAENAEVFEKYMDVYRSGQYLTYTSDIYQEKKLMDELYAEVKTVSEYDQYLAQVQESKESLSGISIFKNADKQTFGSRNVEKSAKAHESLTSENIRWFPSKGISIAQGNTVTDLFLLLSVFLFVGILITEEKEKGLFYITRSTPKGILSSIAAKLAALLVHCLGISLLLGTANFLYAYFAAGMGDLTASLQSISRFMESSLSISVLGYMALGIITKGAVLFGFGAMLVCISVFSSKSFLPQLIGVGYLSVNWLCYSLIPAYSVLNPVKYLSFFGLLNPVHLYGEYLNFNISEHPVSRTKAALVLIGLCCVASVLVAVLLFVKGRSLQISKSHRRSIFPFHPHGNLFFHEGHKILFMGKAMIILLLFAVLIGYGDLGKSYSPSVREQYYRDMMMTLEGNLTEDKEALILSEQSRYDEAFAQIERIDALVAAGELDENTGEDMKTKWYGEVTFYPSFQRVLEQYEHVKQEGGAFLYDSGYRYLFGTMDDSHLIDFLMLSICFVFAFGNVMAMEDQKKSWTLLSATESGKKKILISKFAVCAAFASVMTILPWIFRFISISKVYPLHGLLDSITNLPMYFTFGIHMPVWLFILFAIVLQLAAMLVITTAVLFFSWQRKNYLQAVFLSLLIFAVPPALSMMGIDFAKWCSLYPLYHLTGML